MAPTAQELLKNIARQAMLDRGLLPDFTAEAVTQTNAFTTTGTDQDSAIRDQCGLLWASIDNDDSRDLDQLSVAQPLNGGAVKILVAIADVDSLVKIGSPIDVHAQTNTTSVYTAAQIFPMLPEKLSTDLTSLAQDKDRLSIVVEMTISATGDLTQSDIYRARVRNRAKLAYRSVSAWLDGAAAAPAALSAVPGMDQQIRQQDSVAHLLKQRRHERGALELQSTEARPIFDGGVLSDLRSEQNNRAEDLIEDFMIAANGVGARFLQGKGLASIRRVLRTPERWPQIMTLASDAGASLPATPNAAALNEFLEKRRDADPDRFPDLSLSIIKLLGRGEYALDLPGQVIEGHFGLAVRDYTHSTAPNRRFPDLITQRLIKAVLIGQPAPYSNAQLSSLASHCTQQEDNAAKVERQVTKSAAALLLQDRAGQQFDGIVTGASDKGTWIRIPEPAVEGKIVKGFDGLKIGDRVRVQLAHTDVRRGFIDFVHLR